MSGFFGAILAGGASRRFGETKSLAELDGRPLVRWVAEAVTGVTTKTVLVGADQEVAVAAGLRALQDLRPGLGPLGGLHTALTWLEEEGGVGLLVLGCDMPLVSMRLLEAVRGDGSSSCVVEVAGRVHPLCAYYRIEDLAPVERRLSGGELAMQALVSELSPRILNADDLLGAIRARLELSNINTPDEFRALQEKTV